MRRFLSLIAGPLLAWAASDLDANADIFPAPRYEAGTSFVMEGTSRVGDGSESRFRWELEYTGEGESPNERYDFGDAFVTEHLKIVRKGRPSLGFKPVVFPLEPGSAWSYEHTYNSRNPECGVVTETVRAKAAEEWETDTVAGQALRVLRISHSGTWVSSCGAGKVERHYLYSPELQFYTEGEYRRYSPDGTLYERAGGRITEFTLPE